MLTRVISGEGFVGRASARRQPVGRVSTRHVGLKSDPHRQAGFTLVEMIVVIVITGIIAGIVAIFIRAPVQGYVDSARRAELTDIADTAVRRMARDIRIAVPNSVRANGLGTLCSTPCVEFIPTKDGGRYRAGLPGDPLDFGVADGSFDIIGSAVTFAAGDYIVVGSTQSDGSWAYDTSVNGVLRAYNGAPGAQSNVVITNSVGLRTEAELASQRFDVVDGTQRAVAYQCEGVGTDAAGNGTGVLRRYWNYGFNVAPSGIHKADLVDKVSACTITYDLPNKRFGLVAVHLQIKEANEAVSLYNEIHVNNVP